MEPDHQFSFADLWPTIEAIASTIGRADPQAMAGVIQQELSWRNLRVHPDHTGHGLIGLDDHGMLPDFERWSGLTIGRGPGAAIIPPGMQIEFLAKTLAEYAISFGSPYAAARAWHRGERLMNDAAGISYERLIRAHVAALFG
jgi:hypothetical protein